MSKVPFKQFGPMLDCARNAVMKPEKIKEMIDICAESGYSTLLLYIEDVYEIEDHPYFGYLRGRYTKAELKDINAYGVKKGIEVIPCIQTLGHIHAIFRWSTYSAYRDCNDILLIGEPKVYDLIDKMFATMSECFSTKSINVGMDEAHMVGRGKYYDQHGDINKTELLVSHVKKVAEIAKKYGYTISMWSDMFYRIAANGEYYSPEVEVSDELKALIPDNVELIYWDYYHIKKEFYDSMIASHEKIKKGTYFAGAVGACRGLNPHNAFRMKLTKPAIQSCLDNNIQKVMLCTWGDDGGETSRFAALPSMYYAAQIAQGVKSMKEIKEGFKKLFGISFDAFMLLDLVGGDRYTTDSKNLLFNDIFIGMLDTTIETGRGAKYAAVARKLARYRKHERWGYLFETSYALCKVLELKAELGKRLRAAYQAGDKEALRSIIPDMKEVVKRLNKYHKAYRNQWLIENKNVGFEIQDLRIGGLIKRVESSIDILSDYLSGKIPDIYELEQELLDPTGEGKVEHCRPLLRDYKDIVSPNDIYIDLYK